MSQLNIPTLLFAALVLSGCRFLSHNDPCAWTGISSLLGTLLILLAAFVMRFGTLPPSDSY